MDLKSVAVNGLKSSSGVFLQDLQALPEEAFSQSFGGATRTVADIVYEVNLVNDHIGMVLRGEEPFPWPDGGWIKAPEDFRSKAVVVEAFEKSSQRILATVEALSAEQLAETVQTERGETTRFQRCQFMAVHMWYHSGQLNFIQTLRGDDNWHWS
jgi:uncharacterized damage-inducible protein DinB